MFIYGDLISIVTETIRGETMYLPARCKTQAVPDFLIDFFLATREVMDRKNQGPTQVGNGVLVAIEKARTTLCCYPSAADSFSRRINKLGIRDDWESSVRGAGSLLGASGEDTKVDDVEMRDFTVGLMDVTKRRRKNGGLGCPKKHYFARSALWRELSNVNNTTYPVLKAVIDLATSRSNDTDYLGILEDTTKGIFNNHVNGLLVFKLVDPIALFNGSNHLPEGFNVSDYEAACCSKIDHLAKTVSMAQRLGIEVWDRKYPDEPNHDIRRRFAELGQ